MQHEQQPIIVGLDIGTTKIAAIAGRKNEFGKLEIIGFGRANSNGVKHGQVLNIDIVTVVDVNNCQCRQEQEERNILHDPPVSEQPFTLSSPT